MKIPRYIKEYRIQRVLSHGGYGVIYLAENINTGQKVAIKRDEYNSRTINEIKILTKITSEKEFMRKNEVLSKCNKYIICIFDYYIDNRKYDDDVELFEDDELNIPHYKDVVYIIMELADGKEIFKYIHEGLLLSKRYDIIHQLIEAINYLHNIGVAHRDIKPENIMYDGKNIKLIDFGFGCNFDKTSFSNDKIDEPICAPQTAVGTVAFMAPEVLNKTVIDWQKADIWSMGVTIHEILHLKTFVHSSIDSMETKNFILNREFKIEKSEFPDIDNIILSCLHVDPEKRPSANNVIKMLKMKKRKSSEKKVLSEYSSKFLCEYLIYTTLRLSRLGFDDKFIQLFQRNINSSKNRLSENKVLLKHRVLTQLNCVHQQIMETSHHGRIVVGKLKSNSKLNKIDNFKTIDITSESTTKIGKYLAKKLSPIYLGPITDSKGNTAKTFQNFWQYQKVYTELGHVNKYGNITKKWLSFRDEGFDHKHGDQYAEGTKYGSIYLTPAFGFYDGEKMDDIESRKYIYIPYYADVVKKTDVFRKLYEMFWNNTNLLLLDTDGPSQHLEITPEILIEWMNNPDSKLSHSFVIAGVLLKFF